MNSQIYISSKNIVNSHLKMQVSFQNFMKGMNIILENTLWSGGLFARIIFRKKMYKNIPPFCYFFPLIRYSSALQRSAQRVLSVFLDCSVKEVEKPCSVSCPQKDWCNLTRQFFSCMSLNDLKIDKYNSMLFMSAIQKIRIFSFKILLSTTVFAPQSGVQIKGGQSAMFEMDSPMYIHKKCK